MHHFHDWENQKNQNPLFQGIFSAFLPKIPYCCEIYKNTITKTNIPSECQGLQERQKMDNEGSEMIYPDCKCYE